MMIYWTTKEGEQILPGHMGDQHLVNTVRLVARKEGNLLADDEDWERFCGEGMIHVIFVHEIIRRNLGRLFHSSLGDWAIGYRDIWEHDFSGSGPIDADDWREYP
jgi:hypothetical protein